MGCTLGPALGHQVLQRTMDASSLESLLFTLSSTDISLHPNQPCHPHHDSLPIHALVKQDRRKRKQKSTMDLTRRRDLLQGTRRPVSLVGKRVRVLRRLVPNGESMELDGLFMEVADYIACLQAQIKVMQIMVELLSDGSGK